MSKASWIAILVTAVLLIAGCILFLLPFIFTNACQSSPMTMGLHWLHQIQSTQLDLRKGDFGFEITGGMEGYWRKDIRGLESTLLNGKPARLITSSVAESDIGGTETKVNPPTSDISLRALKFADEPPFDYNKYAVIMWVHEWGRMGWWTLILSQDGVWGKPGKNELDHFPADPAGEGWMPEEEVKRVLTKFKRWDHWLNFWGIR
jgi:hypothetical protein